MDGPGLKNKKKKNNLTLDVKCSHEWYGVKKRHRSGLR